MRNHLRRVVAHPWAAVGSWAETDDPRRRRGVNATRPTRLPQAPTAGSFEDLEGMDISQKVALLREHKNWKCNHRWELCGNQAFGLIDLNFAENLTR